MLSTSAGAVGALAWEAVRDLSTRMDARWTEPGLADELQRAKTRIEALETALAAAQARHDEDLERLRQALGAAGMVGIWDGDSARGIVYADENFARIYGVDPVTAAAGTPSRYFLGYIHPEDAPSAIEKFEAIKSGAADIFDNEHRIVRPDGGIRWVHARGQMTRDAAGREVRFAGVSVDITARKQDEAQKTFLLALQDELRQLHDPDAILQAAAAALGRQLGADRIGYGRVSDNGQTVTVTTPYAPGGHATAGEFQLEAFGARNLARLRAGQTVVYDDVLADPERDTDVWDRIGVRGHVSVPMMRDKVYRGTLFVTFLVPHAWSEQELALIEAVAARVWDAAERGRTEATLRDSEERARIALEAGGFGHWQLDLATGISLRSPRHDEIFGYKSLVEDWTIERFMGHVVPEDRPGIAAGFRLAIETAGKWRATFRITRADGELRWVEVQAKPAPGSVDWLGRLLGVIADITERKQAEARLAASEAQFRSFAEALPHHVFSGDDSGKCDWYNGTALAYSGLTLEQMIDSSHWNLLVHPDDLPAVEATVKTAIEAGQPYEMEVRLRRYDGVYRWFACRALPIRDAEGKISQWLGTSTDIEEQKRNVAELAALNASLGEEIQRRTAELMAAEAALRQSQKMEAVGQLTGGIAHDFNNMLQGIAGALELMERRIQQNRVAEISRYITAASGGVQRAANLTHQLLAFSRRQALAPRRVDLAQLVAGITGLIRQTAGPAIAFEDGVAATAWPVMCDPNQLENAILNLAINARDAMLPAGGTLRIAASHATLGEAETKGWEGAAPGDYVRLSVSDTGTGMSPDVLEHAFEPFFTTKPAGEGTGLGLSQVYGFARQSNGILLLESVVGQGTSVHLFLPRHADVQLAESPEVPPAQPEGNQSGCVLLVEDEITIRNFAGEVLRDLGYGVLEAADGAAGLAILREKAKTIDLLVADVGLPGGLNGRQLADAARELHPGLPVLLITGYAGTALAAALPAGMSILTKPFSWQQLAAGVEAIRK